MIPGILSLMIAPDWYIYRVAERVFPGPSSDRDLDSRSRSGTGSGSGSTPGRRIVSGGHKRPGDVYVDDFPPGCRVMLPSGATGIVRRWICSESKRCPMGRLLIVYDGEGDADGHKAGERVTLSPVYIRRL